LKGIDAKENLMKQKALGREHSEHTKIKKSGISRNPVNIYEKLKLQGL
jgi:hypothetical protein